MGLRKYVLGGAALAAMSMGAALAPSLAPGFVSPAEAQVNVSISIDTFYDDLADEGDWVLYNGAYVFVPGGADPDWRPYTHGRWEYTRRYGWVWVSEDRHGWATHHYGRWGHAPGMGWYWVPDTVWGPAWVDWRRDEEYVAWAPLAPGGNGVVIVVDPVPVPDYYWAAVAAPNFLAVNLSVDLVRGPRLYEVVRRTRPIGYVRPRDNVVIVNNFIEVNFIERRTKKRVKVLEVREARNRREAGKLEGDAIEIYNPRVERKKDAKPRKAETVEQVARKKREKNPDFAARVEERQKRRALKRDAVEEGQAEPQKRKDRAKEAATEPDQGAVEDATAKQKQREERAAKRKQRDEEQAARKKQREERASKQQQPDAEQDTTSRQKQRDEEQAARKKQREERASKQQQPDAEQDTTSKQKQREERAAKRKQREEEQAARKKQRQQDQDASQQEVEGQPTKREERKKRQQQNQSSNDASAEQATSKAEQRAARQQERQAKREERRKKKNQTEEPQQ